MLSNFGFVIKQSFEGTISGIIDILLVIFVILMIFMWISVPFILISIKKELKSINEKLGNHKNEKLD